MPGGMVGSRVFWDLLGDEKTAMGEVNDGEEVFGSDER
jgi:hypothetical protein